MLEIVRGRNWAVAHTVLDSEDGPPTDLSIFTTIACQIREKTATRNARGFFEHKVIATPTVEVVDNVYWLKLSVTLVDKLHTGDYLIDVVGTLSDDSHESLLDPEPVKVVNRPSAPSATPVDEPPLPAPVVIPNFAEEFEEALED